MWVEDVVSRWAWFAWVTGGELGDYLPFPPSWQRTDFFSFGGVNSSTDKEMPPIPDLNPSLLSHSCPLQLAMLRLLLPHGNALSERELLKRCLQGEDVHCVRERVLRIGRVGQVIRDGGGYLCEVACRW